MNLEYWTRGLQLRSTNYFCLFYFYLLEINEIHENHHPFANKTTVCYDEIILAAEKVLKNRYRNNSRYSLNSVIRAIKDKRGCVHDNLWTIY